MIPTGYLDRNDKPIHDKDFVTLENGEKGLIMLSEGKYYLFYFDEPAKTPLHEIHQSLITHGYIKKFENR